MESSKPARFLGGADKNVTLFAALQHRNILHGIYLNGYMLINT
jgi:hypothetical protein